MLLYSCNIQIKITIMKNFKYSIFLLTLLFSLSSFTNSIAKAKPLVKLGSKKVSFLIDKDVIHVGPRSGTFKKIQLKVSGGNLNMHKVLVEYGNGEKDIINVRHNFKKGSLSKVIDLKGSNRVIKDITFWYDTKNGSRQRATLTAFGVR